MAIAITFFKNEVEFKIFFAIFEEEKKKVVGGLVVCHCVTGNTISYPFFCHENLHFF